MFMMGFIHAQGRTFRNHLVRDEKMYSITRSFGNPITFMKLVWEPYSRINKPLFICICRLIHTYHVDTLRTIDTLIQNDCQLGTIALNSNVASN